MKRLIAALALAATAALPAACGREVEKRDDSAPSPAAAESVETPASSTPPIPAPAAGPNSPAGSAAAPGAPAFAVLYPGASLDEPAVTASGPTGPGGLVTYTTEADPEAVIAFYRARAEAAGLSSVMAMNQGEARAYGAAGADVGANLQVVASPTETGETSVQLSWSAGQ